MSFENIHLLLTCLNIIRKISVNLQQKVKITYEMGIKITGNIIFSILSPK